MTISRYIDDRPEEGIFRVHADVFADPELFKLEQEHIFGKAWSFLALESQLVKPNDYVTTYIGTTPILVMRDGKGKLGGFLNVCRHKGALLCRKETGNSKFHVCSYHGWAYSSTGKNIDIKDRDGGCYAKSFDCDDHNLIPIARFETYKGLIFGCLDPEAAPLEEHLGELKTFLDLALEQSPQGLEFVPGRINYTYDANWKLQLDNGLDAYHFSSTHTSYVELIRRREVEKAGHKDAKMFDFTKRFSQNGGMFSFENGHSLIWLNQAQPELRPLYSKIPEIEKRVGVEKAQWMLKLRTINIFPNLQIADSTSLLLRTFRPISANKTEMRVYCMAPIGESPEDRTFRIHQFEDFFNVSGFATPDDTAVYEDCQTSFASSQPGWLQGYQRGMAATTEGASESATAIGGRPLASVEGPWIIQNETVLQEPYREWARLMAPALRAREEEGKHA